MSEERPDSPPEEEHPGDKDDEAAGHEDGNIEVSEDDLLGDDGGPEILDESDVKGLAIDDDSLFESDGDLDEIFSAMEDVKKEEAKAVAKAITAIESGETDAKEALSSLSADVAQKIQQQLEKRSAEEEKTFVTEEDFIKYAIEKQALSKTWYHCLYFLAFKSEDGTANKKVLYEALKEVLSKSPVDPVPEHMFNFGLSALVKVQLYDAPVVKFKAGTFTLQVKRKKMQDLLLAIGRPLSKRPVVTKKEEKKMINDFFGDL